jgi:hypothetical protein
MRVPRMADHGEGRDAYLDLLAKRRTVLGERVVLGLDPRMDKYRAALGPELYRKAAIVILATACTLPAIRKWPSHMMHVHRVEVGDTEELAYEAVLADKLPALRQALRDFPPPRGYRISPTVWFAKRVMYADTFGQLGVSHFTSFDGYVVDPARFPRVVWDLLALPARDGALAWPDGTRATYDLETDRYKIRIDEYVVDTGSVHDAAVLLVRQRDQVPAVEAMGG